MGKLDKILERFPEREFLKADGFDDAVIGFEVSTNKLVYSIRTCMEILSEHDMTEEEAFDFLCDNILDEELGDLTPIWIDDNF